MMIIIILMAIRVTKIVVIMAFYDARSTTIIIVIMLDSDSIAVNNYCKNEVLNKLAHRFYVLCSWK